MIKPDDTILFQGDSITDAHRMRDFNPLYDHGLGNGYAAMAAARIAGERPQDNLKFLNRGISGNRVPHLYGRWFDDCINLKPDVLSILVGINDMWHGFANNTGVEVSRYGEVYRMMLEDTVKALPEIQLILCEPFALVTDPVKEEWLDDLRQRQQIVRDLAKDFNAVFVAFQKTFDDAMERHTVVTDWLTDGVHPTAAGHYAMAQTWYDTVTENN